MMKFVRVGICFCLTASVIYLIVLTILLKQTKRTYHIRTRTNEKIILFGNNFFDYKTWWLPADTVNESYFIAENCPVTNCIITNDRSFLESDLQYDAIIFHSTYRFSLRKLFPKRRAKQIYVFAIKEPPVNTEHDFDPDFNLFNMTMTYRLDSDALWSYGILQDIKTGAIVAPKKQVHWRQPIDEFELDPDFERQLAGKNKMAAWFVSNCGAASKRDDLVRALQKHIDVDVYGKCGPHKCKRFSTECDDKLDSEYKFYLSFENSLCLDYVTEKFFSILDRKIVPVVFGGANYTKFAPPHSYINVEDFETVGELANYLKYLDGNFAEYRKYFWWRKFYRPTTEPVSPVFCELCMRISDPVRLEKNHYYPDIKKWWFDGVCRKPNISFV